MDGESLDILTTQLDKVKKLFPEVITEGKIDWEKLQATLGRENFEFRNERYVLNWAGKSESFKVLQQSTTATLKPVVEESINFDTTENVFIEGENLEVLKILQKAYYGKIKCILIDPPYNTGSDSFIYPDSFKESREDYLKRIGDKDEEGLLMREGFFRKNSKDSGHFHSNWLSMMYPRLFLARNLLREDGIIFIHIDDNEVHNLRLIMNEIFGEENFISEIIVKRASEIASNFTVSKHEYCLCYSKDFSSLKIDQNEKMTVSRGTVGNADQSMPVITFPAGLKCNNIPDGIYKKTRKIEGSQENIENLDEIEVANGELKKEVRLKAKWRSSNDMRNFFANNCQPTKAKISGELVEIYFENDRFVPQLKKRTFEKIESMILENERGSKDLEELGLGGIFDFPKSVQLVKKLLKYTEDGQIVLDFFGGSGTTAEAIMEMNKDGNRRKFILAQLPEKCDESGEAYKAGYKTISQFTIERIKRAALKVQKEMESSDEGLSDRQANKGMDVGIKVFRLSPSNFKIWRGDEVTNANLGTQLDAFTDPVREGSENRNMIYELLLKAGYDLTEEIELKQGYASVHAAELIIAIEDMSPEIIEKIILARPKKVITLDKLFSGNDQLKTNTVLQMKDAGIDFKTI